MYYSEVLRYDYVMPFRSIEERREYFRNAGRLHRERYPYESWSEEKKQKHRAAVARTPSGQPEYRRIKGKENYEKRRATPDGFWRLTSSSIRSRSIPRGVEFDLDGSFLLGMWERQGGLCALTGWPMTLDRSDRRSAASVDRIDPQGGYLRSNVRIVRMDVNNAKSNMTDVEFGNLCRAVLGVMG